VIPVEVTQAPWHFTTWPDAFDHWQTLIAGAFALVAAFGTIAMTRRIANRQIKASREEADKVIAETREQTATTVNLEQTRKESEARAFRAMFEAAMARVLAESSSRPGSNKASALSKRSRAS
jgi:low affinity Fe/Cu permease